MPHSCIYCHAKTTSSKVSMFRFPANLEKRRQWLEALDMTEDLITQNSRVCSKHFLHGNPSSPPLANLGKRFASPKKVDTARSKRATKRVDRSLFLHPPVPAKRLALTPTSVTPSSRASSVSNLEHN